MDPASAQPQPVDAQDDRALMARLQGGDDTALAALMQRWEIPTKAVIGRLVMNASEAEELAQEAFVRVWQQRGRFRPGAEFRPWLFAIAVNLARNRLRWWRRRPTVSLNAWEDRPEEPQKDIADMEADGRVGARAMERSETAAAVRNAIAALPIDLREALVLFEYEGLSHAEIGIAVGATPKAVETRIYRAREKLRTALRHWL